MSAESLYPPNPALSSLSKTKTKTKKHEYWSHTVETHRQQTRVNPKTITFSVSLHAWHAYLHAQLRHASHAWHGVALEYLRAGSGLPRQARPSESDCHHLIARGGQARLLRPAVQSRVVDLSRVETPTGAAPAEDVELASKPAWSSRLDGPLRRPPFERRACASRRPQGGAAGGGARARP